MRHKRRGGIKGGCVKKGYSRASHALRALARMAAREKSFDEISIRVYWCKTCEKFHIGHRRYYDWET